MQKFNQQDVLSALDKCGVKKGDTILVHAALFAIGIPNEPIYDLNAYYLEILQEAVGESGTIVIPAFSYSYCKGETFDVLNSMSTVSALANYCINNKIGYRTPDPNFSHLIITNKPVNQDFSNVSFDTERSIYSYLVDHNATYVMLGPHIYVTLFMVEDQRINAEHRFMKAFEGQTKCQDRVFSSTQYYFCRYNCDNTKTNEPLLEKIIVSDIDSGFIKAQDLGKSRILAVNFKDLLDRYRQRLLKDPWELLLGPRMTRAQFEEKIPDNYQCEIHRQYYRAIDLKTALEV